MFDKKEIADLLKKKGFQLSQLTPVTAQFEQEHSQVGAGAFTKQYFDVENFRYVDSAPDNYFVGFWDVVTRDVKAVGTDPVFIAVAQVVNRFGSTNERGIIALDSYAPVQMRYLNSPFFAVAKSISLTYIGQDATTDHNLSVMCGFHGFKIEV